MAAVPLRASVQVVARAAAQLKTSKVPRQRIVPPRLLAVCQGDAIADADADGATDAEADADATSDATSPTSAPQRLSRSCRLPALLTLNKPVQSLFLIR